VPEVLAVEVFQNTKTDFIILQPISTVFLNCSHVATWPYCDLTLWWYVNHKQCNRSYVSNALYCLACGCV